MPPVCAPNYRRRVVLLNGERVLIRPIDSRDQDSLRAFFGRLGPETRFLRFNYMKAQISEEEIRSNCECDYDNTFTLVAEMAREGADRIVGMARYDRLREPDSAEVAFVVEDREQGNGIGTHLVEELASAASERGVCTLVAETVAYNQIMLSIFRKYDRALKTLIDGGSYRVIFSPHSASRQGDGLS